MIFNIYNFRTMTTKTTQTVVKRRHCRRVLLGVAVLATFALFAACERPEPEPEPPSAPAVDTDTLPANKFVGTWVLCAMNDVNSEPPATCDLANATSDTLVFVDDSLMLFHHGMKTTQYFYEFSDHFLLCYWPEPDLLCTNLRMSIRYSFRNGDQEIVLRGPYFTNVKNFCFLRVS